MTTQRCVTCPSPVEANDELMGVFYTDCQCLVFRMCTDCRALIEWIPDLRPMMARRFVEKLTQYVPCGGHA